MKKAFLLAGVLSALLLGLMQAQTPNFSAERFVPGAIPHNSIIAVVEGDVITEEESPVSWTNSW